MDPYILEYVSLINRSVAISHQQLRDLQRGGESPPPEVRSGRKPNFSIENTIQVAGLELKLYQLDSLERSETLRFPSFSFVLTHASSMRDRTGKKIHGFKTHGIIVVDEFAFRFTPFLTTILTEFTNTIQGKDTLLTPRNASI